MVTWNDSFVYVIGGSNAANAQVDTVYSATITNGQIGPWVTCAPLLQGTDLCFAEVIGTWLVVAGGFINGGARLSSTYYSRIYPDGSLGGWQTAPSLPSAYTDAQNGWNLATTDRAMVLVGNPVLPANNVNVLTFDDVAGPADGWVSTTWPHTTNAQVGAFSNGDGSYDMIGLYPVNQYYEATTLTPVPMISVPLYATGLTNGGTYHVVLQQNKSESASSYLSYGINAAGLPTDARSSLRNANSWSTYSAGNSMPMSVYDTSVSNSVHHTWEDPSNTGSAYTSNRAARVTTTVYDELRRPIGYLEATTQPNDALNVNPTFTSGVTSWTAHNGTFVQSAAQTHGGFPFSGLLTPTGGFSIAYAESEKIPIGSSNAALGTERWIAPNGWFYSPGGYANFSLSVNWYNSAGGFISTSSSIVSLTAATWTNVAKLYQAPLTAASATLAPTEIATPAAGNTVFFSDVVMQLSPETVKPFATVSQITYDSVTAQANGVVIL
jgi:hypothetical protein